MKKYLLIALATSCGVAFAASSESNCDSVRAQIKKNHEGIDAAYHKDDACTMGKLMIQNRHMIESNMACFPKLEQLMEQRQKMQGQ
ncbi:MAG: hypothetical protein EKK64_01635 [Neisseriaceae bacterium]|nr:MAG: hypothetical protein EKK64_01635 [Neisseriaceae bacterium]